MQTGITLFHSPVTGLVGVPIGNAAHEIGQERCQFNRRGHEFVAVMQHITVLKGLRLQECLQNCKEN